MKTKLLALAALAVILSVTAIACDNKNDNKPAETTAPIVTEAPADETTAPVEETTAPEETTVPEETTAEETTAEETTVEETTTEDNGDLSFPFISDVASNMDGVDLSESDLFLMFSFNPGALDPRSVMNGKYALGGINELVADVDGFYAYSIVLDNVISHQSANSYAFCRGVQDVSFHGFTEDKVTDSVRPIGNYYEDDGSYAPGSSAFMMGGAGIYATITEGKLNIVIKYYDPTASKGVNNKYYTLDVDSNKLTFADDGKTVYILAGDKLCATIELSGSKDYDAISTIPVTSFAETAKVTLANGTVETIENTLITATAESQLGIASRVGLTEFSSVSVVGFSTIKIPEMIVG